MQTAIRCFYGCLTLLIASALAVIAFKLTYGSVSPIAANLKPNIDYTNAVVILLTTVTVIFTVAALALAVLSIVGFRNLKKDAGKFASEKAISEIIKSFSEEGAATKRIQKEFSDSDGHLKKWVERHIRKEVIALLPLILSQVATSQADGIDEEEPTDEGVVE